MQLTIDTQQGKPHWQIAAHRNAAQALAGVQLFSHADSWWGGAIGSDIYRAFGQGLSATAIKTHTQNLEDALSLIKTQGLADDVTIAAVARAGRINFTIKINENESLRIL